LCLTATVLLAASAVAAKSVQNGQSQPPPPQQPMPLTADRGFGTPAAVLETAPIFLLPDSTRLPLRIAQAGSQVRVIQQTGEWSNVQFQDPQYGLRTGYMQSRFLRVQPSGGGAETAGVASAQPRTRTDTGTKSESTGFFLGGGFEGASVSPNDELLGSDSAGGAGGGFLAGFGFSRVWSVYGAFSTARLSGDSSIDSYSLSQFDVGARVHFAAPARRTVPFLEAAFSRRSVNQDFTRTSISHTLHASGPGASFGGGVNVHMTPALAIAAAASWTIGDLSTYELDNQDVSVNANGLTSARFHIGLVWFPRGRHLASSD
jgi:hypothetical protein